MNNLYDPYPWRTQGRHIINRLGGGRTNAQGVFWAYAFEVRWAPSQQRETDTKKIAV